MQWFNSLQWGDFGRESNSVVFVPVISRGIIHAQSPGGWNRKESAIHAVFGLYSPKMALISIPDRKRFNHPWLRRTNTSLWSGANRMTQPPYCWQCGGMAGIISN